MMLNFDEICHIVQVPPGILETLLSRIEEGYNRHQNPYHNNLHAADVAQSVHYMLCQSGLMVSHFPFKRLITLTLTIGGSCATNSNLSS